MLKRILTVVFCAMVIMGFTANISRAEEYSESSSTYTNLVATMQGVLTNKKGNSIVINGHYFNGCHIIKMKDMAGGGSNCSVALVLNEAKGIRELRIAVQNYPEPGNSTFSDGTTKPRIVVDDITYYKK